LDFEASLLSSCGVVAALLGWWLAGWGVVLVVVH
jgi:hypothetical protein